MFDGKTWSESLKACQLKSMSAEKMGLKISCRRSAMFHPYFPHTDFVGF